MNREPGLALLLLFSLSVVGWGDPLSGAASVAAPAITSIAVSCLPASITPAQNSACSAAVKGTGNFSSSVIWSATGGTIDSAGVFTPAQAGVATVTARQRGYAGVFGSAAVSVEGAGSYLFFWIAGHHDGIEFWVKGAGILFAIGALVIAWLTHAQRSFFDMIDRLYALPQALEANLLREWYLAHLWCVGAEEYARVKGAIRDQIATDHAELQVYRIREKLFAIQVFLLYEQVYYQWKSSWRILHPGRHRFLSDILSFFHGRLFRNPRLAAFLASDPKGTSLHLEPEAMEHIRKEMTKRESDGRDKPVEPDDGGPFLAPNPRTASE